MAACERYKKKYYETVRTTLGPHGEIQEFESAQVFQMNVEPPFFKVYIEDICLLHEVSIVASGILYELASKMGFDNVVSLGPSVKKRMCERLEIKSQTLENNLGVLVKKGLIHRIGKGEFELNPNLFAKGDWIAISKRRLEFFKKVQAAKKATFIFEVTHDLDKGTKTIKGSINPKVG